VRGKSLSDSGERRLLEAMGTAALRQIAEESAHGESRRKARSRRVLPVHDDQGSPSPFRLDEGGRRIDKGGR